MKSLLFFAITVIFTFPGLSNGFSTGSYFPLSAGALWTFQSNVQEVIPPRSFRELQISMGLTQKCCNIGMVR